jgi:hypothetical protein
MTKDTLPKPDTGAHRRERSTAWQWRIKVPKDLLSECPSEGAHRTSLNTAASARPTPRPPSCAASGWPASTSSAGSGTPSRLAVIAPELGPKRAARIRARMLQLDEERRSGPGSAAVVTGVPDPVRTASGLG